MSVSFRHAAGSLLCLLLLCLLLPLVSAAVDAEVDRASKKVTDRVAVIEQYQAAKDYYHRLESDSKLGDDRSNWIDGVRKFRRLYIAHPGDISNPNSLFMMARMHARMYQRFKHASDLNDAILYYQDVVRIFSRDSLADDALFNHAELLLKERKDSKGAVPLYERIVKGYPDGDRQGEASGRLFQITGVKMTTSPATENRLEAEPNPSVDDIGDPGNRISVLPVKYWSSNEYTRVAIRASKPVSFSHRLLEEQDGMPRRLYVDFAGSYIAPKYRSPVPIEDGLLQRVRSGQFDENTVRVVLDIESIADYKIFSLKDPFRVVIDVWGKKRPGGQPDQPETPVVADKPDPEPRKPAITEPLDEPQQTGDDDVVILSDTKKQRPDGAPADKPGKSAVAEGRPAEGAFTLAQQLGLGVRRIVIDPGHGGKDPGASASGLREKDIVLRVAQKVAVKLEKKYGYDVIMTRKDDTFIELEERTAIANTRRADLFVSIHVNAHPNPEPHGIETFFLNLATNDEAMRVAALENATSKHNLSELQGILSDLMRNNKIQESSRLAEHVQKSLVSGLEQSRYPVKNLGVKQAPFYVLIGAQMPAILAEISFISNPGEAKLLKQNRYLDHIADYIAAGIVAYVDSTTTAALR